MKKSIFKDSFTLLVSEGTSLFISAITSFIIPRILSVSEFGKFAVAASFAQILAIGADSGMGQFVAKEMARDSSAKFTELNQVFSWRLWIVMGVSFVTPLLARMFLPTPEIRILAYVLTPATLLLTMSDFMGWVLRGIQRVRLYAVLQLSSRLCLFILCLAVWFFRKQLAFLLVVHVISGIFVLVFGWTLLERYVHKIRIAKLTSNFYAQTLPNIYKMGIIVFVGAIFSRMDVMLVGTFYGGHETGLFGSAARLIDGFRIVAIATYGLCLPRFSKAHNDDLLLKNSFNFFFYYLLIASTFLALTSSIFSEFIFTHLFGQSYRGGAVYFSPLIWSCLFNFANVVMFAVLYVKGKYRIALWAVGLAVIVDLVLNLIFLPTCGVITASWVKLVAEAVGFGIQAYGLFDLKIISVVDLIIIPSLIVGPVLFIYYLTRYQAPHIQWLLSGGALAAGAFLVRSKFHFVLEPAEL